MNRRRRRRRLPRTPLLRDIVRGYRSLKRGYRFVKRNFLEITAVAVGVGAGVGLDRLADVSGRTQLITAALVAALMLVGKLVLGVGYGAIYRIWTWHPDDMCLFEHARRAVVGYIGKTRQRPEERIRQHLEGSVRYGSPAQPWADTVVRWEVIHESRWMTNIGLHLREKYRIAVHRPLYNYTMNLGNSRRIPKPVAQQQRAERDAMRVWAA